MATGSEPTRVRSGGGRVPVEPRWSQPPYRLGVRVNLLGPVQVGGAEGGEVLLGAAKERSLLAALALRPGSVMAVDALIDAIWGETAPPSARKTLQTYVSNLRRALGPDAVVTHPSGYSLSLRAEDTDVGCFRALVREGEQALRAGRRRTRPRGPRRRRRPGERSAPGWRRAAYRSGRGGGAARRGVPYRPGIRVEADLAAGSGADLVGELEILVHDHPFRERLWAHLLVALYRSGRQADALAAYQRARRLLRDQLGLEPGGELQRLERAILDQDPRYWPRPRRWQTHPPDARGAPLPGPLCGDPGRHPYRVPDRGQRPPSTCWRSPGSSRT